METIFSVKHKNDVLLIIWFFLGNDQNNRPFSRLAVTELWILDGPLAKLWPTKPVYVRVVVVIQSFSVFSKCHFFNKTFWRAKKCHEDPRSSICSSTDLAVSTSDLETVGTKRDNWIQNTLNITYCKESDLKQSLDLVWIFLRLALMCVTHGSGSGYVKVRQMTHPDPHTLT